MRAKLLKKIRKLYGISFIHKHSQFSKGRNSFVQVLDHKNERVMRFKSIKEFVGYVAEEHVGLSSALYRDLRLKKRKQKKEYNKILNR